MQIYSWILVSEEPPVYGPLQLYGFATVHVLGFPNECLEGTFITKGEYLRLNGRNVNWAPYAESRDRRNMNKSELLFIDKRNFVYAEHCLVAWMPYPDPYKEERSEDAD